MWASACQRQFEIVVAGRLSPERFDKLSTQYEEEQKQVRQTIGELQSLIDDGEQEAHGRCKSRCCCDNCHS